MRQMLLHALLLSSLAVLAVEAPDTWPDYRGPDRNGRAPEGARLPLEWDEERNLSWKVPVHGRGWSSPVIAEAKIWLTTATEDGTSLSVLAFDLESGALLHDKLVFEVEEPQRRNKLNSFASPSPTVEAGRVYVHFGYAGTACLDTATAETLWTRRDLLCDHMEGPGSSPLLHEGLLILHVDGGDLQYVVALDKESGETVWERPRDVELDHLPKDLRKAFSTPIVYSVDGEEVLVSSAAQATFGYDLADGEEVWRVHHSGFSMSSRPLSAGGLLFLNTGFMKPRLLALRPDGVGDVTDSHVAWEVKKNVPSMASPVAVGDYLYMIDDGGIASCLELRSGERVWRERIGGDTCASPIHASGRIYFFDRNGKTTVVALGPNYRELAVNQLDEGFMASPAVAGDSFILRGEHHLYRIAASSSSR